MKFTSVVLVTLLLLPPVYLHSEEEALSDTERALFDDLAVTEVAEKAWREQVGKAATVTPSGLIELPSTATKLIEKLGIYEQSMKGMASEVIAQSRIALSGQLIKLSALAAEPRKTELIAVAKGIEGMQPSADLPMVSTVGDFPGEWILNAGDKRWYYGNGQIKTKAFSGTWRYLNHSNRAVVADYANTEYVDVLRMVIIPGKPPVLEGINQKGERWTLSRGQSETSNPVLPTDANKLIATARIQEAQLRTKSGQQVQDKRERVAAWLVEKAKTTPPAVAKLLLEQARRLRYGANDLAMGNNNRSDIYRGKIFSDSAQRSWEFLSNGAVKSRGLPWGSWEWAKSGEDPSLLIYSGGPGKVEQLMLVRPSQTTSGKLYFIGFEKKFDAIVKQGSN